MDNLLPLCRKCNLDKADMFAWPNAYYMALHNGPVLSSVMDYTYAWLDKYLTREYLQEYPMIASRVSMHAPHSKNINFKYKQGMVIPQLTLDITELTQEDNKEIKELTGLSKKNIFDMQLHTDQYFSVYALSTRVSRTKIALFSIQADKNDNFIVITNLWKNTSSKMVSAAVAFIVQQFHFIWMKDGLGYDNVLIRMLNKADHDNVVNGYYDFYYDRCIVPASNLSLTVKGSEDAMDDLTNRLGMFKSTTVMIGFKTDRIEREEEMRNEIREKLRNSPTK